MCDTCVALSASSLRSFRQAAQTRIAAITALQVLLLHGAGDSNRQQVIIDRQGKLHVAYVPAGSLSHQEINDAMRPAGASWQVTWHVKLFVDYALGIYIIDMRYATHARQGTVEICQNPKLLLMQCCDTRQVMNT